MIRVFAVITERIVGTACSRVICTQTIGAEFRAVALFAAVSSSAVGADILINIVVHTLVRGKDRTEIKHGVSFEPIFCIGYVVKADLHGCWKDLR